MIFDINKYAINDGPGIRLTIFLKGCSLSCAWCHNPESRSASQQKMYNKDRCIGCSECVDACPEHACHTSPEGIQTTASACILCGRCAAVCPAKATEISGKSETIENLVRIIEKEKVFFAQSGGGVTISGGEPLMHPGFLTELLDACGKSGIHRAVDTTGYASTEVILEVAKHTDLFLYDLKMMDDAKHRQYTGVGNTLILHNLRVLAESGANVIIRIPVIKGINDNPENIEETAAFVAALKGKKKVVNLLPYHSIASKKYEKLGMDYDSAGMGEPGNADLERIIQQFREFGLEASIGG